MKHFRTAIFLTMTAMFWGGSAGFLSGCASTADAYQAANGLEQTAYVMNNHFLALIKEANALAESGTLSGTSLAKAQEIVKTARPLLAELSNIAQTYAAAQTAENEEALKQAIAAAAVQLSSLVNAIRAAGGSAQSVPDTYQFTHLQHFAEA